MSYSKWTPADISTQEGKRVIVTGANSGIGFHTAFELARAGAEVILACRRGKGPEARKRIIDELPGARVSAAELDLASLASVRAFASAQLAENRAIDLLVNNAGVMAIPQRTVTEDGFETQFGTNYLGPFALTALLLPGLLGSRSPRVTMVSSAAHKQGRINFDDLQSERSSSAWGAYGRSKLADLMFTFELQRQSKLAGSSLLSTAAHPGYAVTNLQTSGPSKTTARLLGLVAPLMAQDAAHGAWPTLLAATNPRAQPGDYYGPDGFIEMRGHPRLASVSPRARDEDSANRLWNVSLKLTNVVFRWS